jgi:uncharacterized YigZ family protein
MLSIKENVCNELIINKSKFIANIYFINSEEDVSDHLNQIKEKYEDATHYCYSYILDNKKRFNDDKEPNGTAGKPILDVLEKNNLNHVLCIVIRYFGGTKLGASGLVRAYSNSASKCIEKSNIVNLEKGTRIELMFEYDKQKDIDYLLNNVISKEYKEKIKYIADVDNQTLKNLQKYLDIKILGEVYLEKNSN